MHTVRAALTCSEAEFPTEAIAAVLGRKPTVQQTLPSAGRPELHAAIIRALQRIATDENRPAPDHWALSLPRRIDVSRMVSANFIETYRAVLGRTPSAPEVAAQASWRPALAYDLV